MAYEYARHATTHEDVEEYHSLIDSSLSTGSDRTVSFEASTVSAADETLPPPPLETPTAGAVHADAAHCRTVLGSMQQVVPIAVRASLTGTKRSGLFFAGELAVPVGQMLFLTHPAAMVHAAEAGAGPKEEEGQTGGSGGDGRDQARAVCDYCFKGPDALVEREQGGFEKGRAAQRCTGCFALSFCSTTCHRKAWKQFHKYECSYLGEMRGCDPVSLTLLRLLLLDAANCIPKNVMAVMQTLTDPPLYSAEPNLQRKIQNCVSYLRSSVLSTKRSPQFIRDLLRRILGNQVNLKRADGSARVLCFDVALANLNHSCEPNAYVFVEGRQARVRTAQTIHPGEEITVDLVDLHFDVIRRNSYLKMYSADMDYACGCRVCEKEITALSQVTPREAKERSLLYHYDEQVIPRATQLMAAIADEVWEDRRRSLVQQLAELADMDSSSARGIDPEKDRPKVWVRMAVASVYFGAGDLENALYYALKSFFFHDHRATPDTVAAMRIVVHILVAISQLPETDKQYRRMFGPRRKEVFAGFPGPAEFRVFASGCLTIYQQLAVVVFGPKLSFVRAVLHWGRDKQTLCEPVEQGSSVYDQTFEAAQQKLLNWCRDGKTDVYTPLRPPSVSQLQQMQMLMDALDDKPDRVTLRETLQREAQATDGSQDIRGGDDAGYQADSDTAEADNALPAGPQWVDKNQMHEEAYGDAEKTWQQPAGMTDGMVPVAVC